LLKVGRQGHHEDALQVGQMRRSDMRSIGVISALIYTVLSLIVAGLFVLGATLAGHTGLVERAGGAAWVFLLSMIILMPIVTPLLKKRLR